MFKVTAKSIKTGKIFQWSLEDIDDAYYLTQRKMASGCFEDVELRGPQNQKYVVRFSTKIDREREAAIKDVEYVTF